MLEIARRAFPVNPSPALLEAAARNGWGYFRPHRPKASLRLLPGNRSRQVFDSKLATLFPRSIH